MRDAGRGRDSTSTQDRGAIWGVAEDQELLDQCGAAPGRRLTDRNLATPRDLTRFCAMTVEPVARRRFGTVETAAHRSGELVNAGLVRVERPS